MDSIQRTNGRQEGVDTAHRDRRHGLLRLPARMAVLLIRIYQKMISPWLGPRCRFHPTCSQYCIDALNQHGMVLGLWLGIKRIGKCHPFHPGGYDPVPGRHNEFTEEK